MKYECERCGYTTNHLNNFRKHETRVYPCKIKKKEIERIASTESLIHEEIEEIEKSEEMEEIKKPKEIKKEKIELEKFQCEYCLHIFKHAPSYSRHKKTCKKNPNNNESTNNKSNHNESTNNKQEHITGSSIHDIYDSTIQNLDASTNVDQSIKNYYTININSFDKNQLINLSDDEILKLLGKTRIMNIFKNIVDKTHYNSESPENTNIYISSLRGDFVMVYNGSKWVTDDREKVLEYLMSNNRNYIETKLCDWTDENLYPDAREKLNEYLEKLDNSEDGDEKVKKDITLLLYNNRDMAYKYQCCYCKECCKSNEEKIEHQKSCSNNPTVSEKN